MDITSFLRRRSGRTRRVAEVDTHLLSRAGAYLYGSGATLVLVSLLFPHTRDVQPLGVAGIAGLALALATMLFLVGRHFPVWLLALVSPMGSVMVGGVMFFGGGYAIAFSMLYVWAALYAFSYFPARSALLQGAVIAVTAAFNLLIFKPLPNSPAFVLMVIGTGAVAGVFVDRLIRQVKALGRLDAVTRVPNRAAWEDEIARALARAARSANHLSVVIADLDHFKVFNDEYGHQAGDRLLAEVVKVWGSALRATDLLSRYGGEEFAVLLEDCNVEEAFGLAEKLRQLVPAGQTASFGVAEWDQREAGEALVQRADSALYEAKHLGRNRSVTAPNRLTLEVGHAGDTARWAGTVREILDTGRDGTYQGVTSVYQPVVRLDTQLVVAAEALARPTSQAQWLSVEGLFYTAQRIGLARELDWLCRRSAVDGAVIFDPAFHLFMNVSTVALLDPMQDVDQLDLVLARAGRLPSSVVLELSEREIVVDHQRLADILDQYRMAGYRFAIDDLGEGHSGFALLEATMPDYIKLSRKLTNGMDLPGTRSLLAAALAFAGTSGCEVVAEGIENEEQVGRLLDLGVTLGQGYHVGRPVAPPVLLERVQREGRTPGQATKSSALSNSPRIEGGTAGSSS